MKLCRACLKPCDEYNFSLVSNQSNFNLAMLLINRLKFCFPEMNVDVSTYPVLCKPCVLKLETVYEMKKTVSETEEKIVKYILKSGITSRLQELDGIVENPSEVSIDENIDCMHKNQHLLNEMIRCESTTSTCALEDDVQIIDVRQNSVLNKSDDFHPVQNETKKRKLDPRIRISDENETQIEPIKVRDILNKTRLGAELMGKLDLREGLSTNQKVVLTRILIDDLIETNSLYPTKEQKLNLAESIVKEFPSIGIATESGLKCHHLYNSKEETGVIEFRLKHLQLFKDLERKMNIEDEVKVDFSKFAHLKPKNCLYLNCTVMIQDSDSYVTFPRKNQKQCESLLFDCGQSEHLLFEMNKLHHRAVCRDHYDELIAQNIDRTMAYNSTL